MLLGDFAKAEEAHSAKLEDINGRHAASLEKLEREKKDIQKDREEGQSQLSSENDKLLARLKQLENDAIMAKKVNYPSSSERDVG